MENTNTNLQTSEAILRQALWHIVKAKHNALADPDHVFDSFDGLIEDIEFALSLLPEDDPLRNYSCSPQSY